MRLIFGVFRDGLAGEQTGMLAPDGLIRAS
jgi:hypothetical protein